MGVEYTFLSMARSMLVKSKDKLKKVMVNITIVMVISILENGWMISKKAMVSSTLQIQVKLLEVISKIIWNKVKGLSITKIYRYSKETLLMVSKMAKVFFMTRAEDCRWKPSGTMIKLKEMLRFITKTVTTI